MINYKKETLKLSQQAQELAKLISQGKSAEVDKRFKFYIRWKTYSNIGTYPPGDRRLWAIRATYYAYAEALAEETVINRSGGLHR